MKRISAVLLIMLMLCPNLAFAEEPQVLRTITKEYEFNTKSFDFEYTQGASFEPPEEITEDGAIYKFKSIVYELITQKELFLTEQVTFYHEVENKGMVEKDETIFEEIIQINDESFEGEAVLKEVTYAENVIKDRTASTTESYDYGFQSSKPIPPDTLDVLYHDESSNSDVLTKLNFVKLNESNAQWEDNIHVEQTYRSIYVDEYLLNDGTRLVFNCDQPEYEGFEDVLLEHMRLKKENYRIVGSKWIGDIKTSEGQTTRIAQYTVNRYVKEYSAVYSGSFELPNILTYDATAHYVGDIEKQVPDGIDYTVKAIVTYEEKPIPIKKNLTPVIAGTTGGVIGLCGLVFFLIKKRNKE
jgi:hypothetical protein